MNTADQILKIAEELRRDREWTETSKGSFAHASSGEWIVVRYHSLGEGEVSIAVTENSYYSGESYFGPNPLAWWAGQGP